MEVLRSHLSEIVLVLAVLVIVLLFTIWSLNSRVQSLSRQLRGLMTGATGDDLETILHETLAEGQRASDRCDAIEVRLAQLIDKTQNCLQHTGLVRFDAFPDASGQQSFSVALLNGEMSGVIVTSIFGRQESRCFGKDVSEGRALQALSGEEEVALRKALAHGRVELNGSENGLRRPRRRRDARQQVMEEVDE